MGDENKNQQQKTATLEKPELKPPPAERPKPDPDLKDPRKYGEDSQATFGDAKK
jgi:hypothetical protein